MISISWYKQYVPPAPPHRIRLLPRLIEFWPCPALPRSNKTYPVHPWFFLPDGTHFIKVLPLTNGIFKVNWSLKNVQNPRAVLFLNSKSSACWEEEAGFKTETDSNKSSFPADSDRTASLILSHYNLKNSLSSRSLMWRIQFYFLCSFRDVLFPEDAINFGVGKNFDDLMLKL